jgi:hypothetical protein
MPTKQQIRKNSRNIKKKTWNNTTVAVVVIAAVFILVLSVYLLLHRSPDVKSSEATPLGEESISESSGVSATKTEGLSKALISARLQLKAVDNKDILKVVTDKVTGKSGTDITYKFDWKINGQATGDGSDSISGFKRGDKVTVQITPFDGEAVAGQSRTLSMEIANTTPKIVEQKESPFDGKTFTMQVKATDPDGDTLSYELLNGPEGMIIDKKSGMVSWPLKENNGGDYPIKVKITDGHGGETTYQLTATIPKKSPLSATTPQKSP